VALTAVFYHAIGHGLAKGLAFLSIAEATHAAGSRDLERLGGLARRLPRLSIAALASILALCGLPLLSCFAGEWLTFQALILGYSAGEGSLRLIAPFAVAALALATALGGGLIKLYGIGFLGRPRTAEAAAATPVAARVEIAFLAGAVLIGAWGIGASWAVTTLARPVSAVLLAPFDTHELLGAGGLTLTIPPHAFASIRRSRSRCCSPCSSARVRVGTARDPRAVRRAVVVMRCGATPRMQYSALGCTKRCVSSSSRCCAPNAKSNDSRLVRRISRNGCGCGSAFQS
jgi:hypothetical protein